MDSLNATNTVSTFLRAPTEKSIMKEALEDVKYNQLSGKKVQGFHIGKVLGEGGFGIVYRCTATTKKGTTIQAAFKAESMRHDGISVGLLFESKILQKLEESENNLNFTVFYGCGIKPHFSYLVMSLLGPNLYDICVYLPGEKFEMSTWVRVSYQMLQAIRSLHNIGYLHNDLKPANFAIGDKDSEAGSIIIYLFDFGLAREYGSKECPKGVLRTGPKTNVEYIGTITHCSPNSHKRIELGRRDDLYGWMYLMMDFFNELPWRRCETDEEIENCKLSCTLEIYCKYLPKTCAPIIKHIMSLGIYDEPKYDQLFERLRRIMRESKVRMDDYYQWELLPLETKKILNLRLEQRKVRRHIRNKSSKGRGDSKRKGSDKGSLRKGHTKKQVKEPIGDGNGSNKQIKKSTSLKGGTTPSVCKIKNNNTVSPKQNIVNSVFNSVVNNFQCMLGTKTNRKAKTMCSIDVSHKKALTQEFAALGGQNVDDKIEKKCKTIEQNAKMAMDKMNANVDLNSQKCLGDEKDKAFQKN
uniref:Protein kinase domain-containing protein n=1 Tax=Parastrongyloides trichosuri TaxID=131310 RepID=A0A0N4Z477_PARTI